MTIFTKILLATDGSEYIVGAEREAINFAKICNSEICIMSVVLSNSEYDKLAPKLVKQAEQDAINCMDLVQNNANSAGIKSYTILRHSEYIYPEIVTTAKEHNIDLIVVGRRGKKGLFKLLLGSRTAEVINHVHCSVLVIPRTAEIKGKHILLAVDNSNHDEVAKITAKLAKYFNAPVTVITVVHTEFSKDNSEIGVARICGVLQTEGIEKLIGQVVVGKYAETIVKIAKNLSCDLIVVGNHGHTSFKNFWLGSVSEKVIKLAESAVLVVRN
ncbi:MAG TPA: universal stress protein [Thioploca sp.]|nr:universal stress protein [Thioploca sp.]